MTVTHGRWIGLVLALPLAVGAVVHAVIAYGSLFWTSEQDIMFHVVNTSIQLLPMLVYVVGIIALVSYRGGVGFWIVLLLIGVLLSGVSLYYTLSGGLGVLLLIPPYFAVVCGVQVALRVKRA